MCGSVSILTWSLPLLPETTPRALVRIAAVTVDADARVLAGLSKANGSLLTHVTNGPNRTCANARTEEPRRLDGGRRRSFFRDAARAPHGRYQRVASVSALHAPAQWIELVTTWNFRTDTTGNSIADRSR
jgi:hypothetical protein